MITSKTAALVHRIILQKYFFDGEKIFVLIALVASFLKNSTWLYLSALKVTIPGLYSKRNFENLCFVCLELSIS
jgi:hypothetical protein